MSLDITKVNILDSKAVQKFYDANIIEKLLNTPSAMIDLESLCSILPEVNNRLNFEDWINRVKTIDFIGVYLQIYHSENFKIEAYNTIKNMVADGRNFSQEQWCYWLPSVFSQRNQLYVLDPIAIHYIYSCNPDYFYDIINKYETTIESEDYLTSQVLLELDVIHKVTQIGTAYLMRYIESHSYVGHLFGMAEGLIKQNMERQANRILPLLQNFEGITGDYKQN